MCAVVLRCGCASHSSKSLNHNHNHFNFGVSYNNLTDPYTLSLSRKPLLHNQLVSHSSTRTTIFRTRRIINRDHSQTRTNNGGGIKNTRKMHLRKDRTLNRSGTGVDVIIVGAGVAGSVLAHALAKDGRCVHVIDRDLREPNRIVGELLQPGGYMKLMELGLEDCVEQIDAQRLLGYVFFKDGKNTKLSYPLEKFQTDMGGRSFHNGRFIQRLREKAAALPSVRLEQGTVTSLLQEDNNTIIGVQYKTKHGQKHEAFAPLTIVCNGCFSNLRHALCHPKVEVPSCSVGLVLENCQLPFKNYGLVILADPSPIVFYPISTTEVRCLVDIPGQKVPPIGNGEMANYLKTVVAPQIPPELHDAFITAINRGNIRTMPNSCMPADPFPTPGALLVGDAFNMRHPLTGGGMTVALSDIVVLCDLLKPLCDLNDAATICRYLESFYILRKVNQYLHASLHFVRGKLDACGIYHKYFGRGLI